MVGVYVEGPGEVMEPVVCEQAAFSGSGPGPTGAVKPGFFFSFSFSYVQRRVSSLWVLGSNHGLKA